MLARPFAARIVGRDVDAEGYQFSVPKENKTWTECPPPKQSDDRGGQSSLIADCREAGLANRAFIACGAPSHRGDCGNRDPRKVDGENASLPGEVAGIDSAVVLFDAPATEGETQAGL